MAEFTEVMEWASRQPMDADVARKLGIKPIKGRSEDA